MHQWNVVLRDGQQELRYELSSEKAMALVAGLSCDPETIEELVAGTRRFLGDRWHDEWLSDHQVARQEEATGSDDYCIDIPGRLILHSTRAPEPPRLASVRVHDEVREEPYLTEHHLADDWEIRPWMTHWRDVAETRREQRRIWLRDGRRVLYEDLATGLIAIWRQEVKPSRNGSLASPSLADLAKSSGCQLSERTMQSLITRIHARWLLTPRLNLQNKTPRELLVEHVEHVRLDIGHRTDQWIATGHEVEPRSASSAAYAGPYVGPVELTFYHQLVEKLIRRLLTEVVDRSQAAKYRGQTVFEFRDGESEPIATSKRGPNPWKMLSEMFHSVGLDAFPDDILLKTQAEAEFNEAEIRDLVRVLNVQQADFLDFPDETLCGFSPGQLITMERKRLPISVDREFSPVDCDCPLCVMLEHQASILLWDPSTDWFPTDFVFSRVKSFDSWEPELEEDSIDAAWRGEDHGTDSAETNRVFLLNGSDGEPARAKSFNVGDRMQEPFADVDDAILRARRQLRATLGIEYRCLLRMFESPFIMTVTLQEEDDALTASPAFQALFELGASLATMIGVIKEEKRKAHKAKQAVKRINDQFRAIRDHIIDRERPESVAASIRQLQHSLKRHVGHFPKLQEHLEPFETAVSSLCASLENEGATAPASAKRASLGKGGSTA